MHAHSNYEIEHDLLDFDSTLPRNILHDMYKHRHILCSRACLKTAKQNSFMNKGYISFYKKENAHCLTSYCMIRDNIMDKMICLSGNLIAHFCFWPYKR